MTLRPGRLLPPSLRGLLLPFAVIEGIALLMLTVCAGFLYLSLAKLTQPVMTRAIGLVCVVLALAAVWQSYKIAYALDCHLRIQRVIGDRG
jgi:small-conductance mechanosensitive channel